MADRRSTRKTAARRGGRKNTRRAGGSLIAVLGLAALAVMVIGGGTLLSGTFVLESGEVAVPTQVMREAVVAGITPPALAASMVSRAPTALASAPPGQSPIVPTPRPTEVRPTRAVPTPAPLARPSPVIAASPLARPSGATVALTFDAGSDRGYTAAILDLLQKQSVHATFGITGRWAQGNPELVRRMASEGHLVINHTLDHQSFTGASDNLGGLGPARRRAELEEADAIIAPLIGRSTKPWYRLPYGDDDARVVADVAPAGYNRKAGWTVDSLGWRGLSAAEIAARCLRLAAPNAVYVFHVGSSSQDGPALPSIVEGLRTRGYGFATMADLP